MRYLLALAAFAPLPALAEAYHDLGKPDQCGAYAEASYDRQTWFPGGEGGIISLSDPQSVRGLNVALFEGAVTEEGFADPAGRVLALRGPLVTADGPTDQDVLVIMTDGGVRLLQRCP